MSKAMPLVGTAIAAVATILLIIAAATPGYYKIDGMEVGPFRTCSSFSGYGTKSVHHSFHTSQAIDTSICNSYPPQAQQACRDALNQAGTTIGTIGTPKPGTSSGSTSSICDNYPVAQQQACRDQLNQIGAGGSGGSGSGSIDTSICDSYPASLQQACRDALNNAGSTIGNVTPKPGQSSSGSGSTTPIDTSICNSYPASSQQACRDAINQQNSGSTKTGGSGTQGFNLPSSGAAMVCTTASTKACESGDKMCQKSKAVQAFLIIAILAGAAATIMSILYLALNKDMFPIMGAGGAMVSAIAALISIAIAGALKKDVDNLAAPYYSYKFSYGFGLHIAALVMMISVVGVLMVSFTQARGSKVLHNTARV